MSEKKIGAILSFIIIFLKIGITFLYIPFVLDKIGKDSYGLFAIVSSVIAYIAILDFGINDSTLRYFVKYRKESSEKIKINILGSVSSIYSIIGILVVIASVIVYFCIELLFSNTFSIQELILFKKMYVISAVSIFFTVFFNPVGAILNAYEKFIVLKVTDILVFIATTITIVFFLNTGYGVVEMVLISAIFNIGSIIFKYSYVISKYKIRYPTYKPSKIYLKEIVLYAGPIFIVVIIEQIYWKLDNIIIGATIGATMVTYYAMGIVFQKYILSFATAISRIMTPDLIKSIDLNNSINSLTNNYIKTSRIQLIVVLLIILNLIFWGKSFLIIWIGEEYIISYYVLLLIMIPFSLEIIGNLRNTFLQVYGYYWQRAIVILFVSLLNVVLTIILVKKFGVIGAAASTCLGLFLGYGITNYILWKKVGIDIKKFFKEVWLKSLMPIIITAFVWYVTSLFIQVDSWFKLILAVGITSIVYVITMGFLYLTALEKATFINLYNRKKLK
ncbi:MAG: hypothetical protein COW66_02860 [Flavobacteriaceae bacterium CG18_big_fil_WC_8_21_14_2_50_34_36]|nr:MAG: hypothetical protein COW66_02860 [Flavobacteriaceae bacterium CG18_big_fil_WC_8_21_14_2_50_34_36]